MYRILIKAGLPLAMALLLALTACGAYDEPESRAGRNVSPSRFLNSRKRSAALPPPQQQSVHLERLKRQSQPRVSSIGGSATPTSHPIRTAIRTFFQHYGVNPFIDTEDDHLSTFAVDVDTASYTVTRRFLGDGNTPDPNSVRVEEFVNYFDQGYEPPTEDAFAIHIEGSPSPFGSSNHWLMRVGLQGREVGAEERKDATLVFTIDVSGSMGREDRLGLVKQSLRLLVDELRSDDQVAIVVYGDRGSVLLRAHFEGRNKGKILRIDSIFTLKTGSKGLETFAEDGRARARLQAGLRRGRAGADNHRNAAFRRRRQRGKHWPGIDSAANQDAYVEQGVTLTTVGFGMGNYNDILMEQLANDGDGAYYYVDTLIRSPAIIHR